MVLFLSLARAATLDVCASGCTYDSVVAAIDDATDGDTIQVGPGTYSGAIQVGVDVAIVGAGSDLTTLDSLGANATVDLQQVTASLEGLTIAVGNQRAVDVSEAVVVLTDILVVGGTGQSGVGVRARQGADLTVVASRFEALTTNGNGGAVLVEGSTTQLAIEGVTCTGTDAANGGCVAIDGASATLTDLVTDGCTASTAGGAVWARDFGSVAIEAGEMSGGGAPNGGHVDVALGASLTIDATRFVGGSATRGGAVRFGSVGGVSIDGATFVGNAASEDGGAVFATSPAEILGARFEGNSAVFEGGAVYLAASTWTLARSTFEANTAQSGGALSVNSGTLSASDLRMLDNQASGTGGALTSFGNVGLSASYLCGNAAPQGAALHVAGNATTVRNSVLFANAASLSGGAAQVAGGSLVLEQVDVVANTAPDGGGIDVAGPFSADHTLFEAAAGYAVVASGAVTMDWNAWWANQPSDVGGALVPSDRGPNTVEGDPLLPWSLDGHCGDESFVPPAGSPLVDADPTGSDADGSDRDIGAFGGPGSDGFADGDGDGFAYAFDCDDASANVNPSRAEDCGNGVDNDCNGIVDDCGSGQDWYRDADGDGYGDAADSTSAPTAPPGYVADATDCDDADPLVHPGADERCNDADDDCDGQTDEGIDQTWYVDADGDGYGGEAASGDCEAPPDAAAVDGDCDDGDPAVSPAATEIWYDGIDQDCDGNDADRDLDGFAAEVSGGTDCDDDDPAIHPDADEVIDDGVDQDCNGADAITTFGVAGKRPTGCGCAAPTAPPGWVFLLAAVLVRRQRTRSAHRTRATCGRTG